MVVWLLDKNALVLSVTDSNMDTNIMYTEQEETVQEDIMIAARTTYKSIRHDTHKILTSSTQHLTEKEEDEAYLYLG
uniref:Uncharacterized protein n=1 Tax=Arion vulgaris TaxID=1028688 RepID=A0A0B6ZY25_9EUPU